MDGKVNGILRWSYRDRIEAGKALIEELNKITFDRESLVLAIPNGGIKVALPIAEAFGAELDLLIVRKLQIPHNPEAGFGAITSLGTVILNNPLVARIGLTKAQIASVIQQTKDQITERREAYAGLAGDASPLNRKVILVDDGLASGYTMLAAVQSVKKLNPRSITVAVPTASAGAVKLIREAVDHLVSPRVETGFIFAVANAYQEWYDIPDSEILEILTKLRG